MPLSKVTTTICDLYESKYPSNPFFEKWSKGRPSLEKLIRKDFFELWREDYGIKTVFLSTLLTNNPPTSVPTRALFIKRGQ